MTRMTIDPGVCGFQAIVEVEKKGKKRFSVEIRSECEWLQELGKRLEELTLQDAFRKILDNPVYRKASSTLQHAACPVPSGILKALEVEAGLALPKDVTIKFLESD